MKKIAMKTFCILCVFILAFALTACILNFGGYNGSRKDLYSVAVNNIFGIHGYKSNGEVVSSPDIHTIETDNYGRTLFFYSEYCDYSAVDYGMAFVVMQKSADGYAYYYPDKCYIPYFDTTSNWDTISEKIDSTLLDRLKEENDWNNEIDNEKCFKVKIKDEKSEGKIRPKSFEFDKIIYSYELKNGYSGGDTSFCKFSIYCETDSNGSELHYVSGMTMNQGDDGEDVFNYYVYAIILDSEGNCSENGIVRIPDVEDSFALINELKQNNNWNSSR